MSETKHPCVVPDCLNEGDWMVNDVYCCLYHGIWSDQAITPVDESVPFRIVNMDMTEPTS